MDFKNLILVFILVSSSKIYGKDLEEAIKDVETKHTDTVVLSRAKRFLMFPEGSSFQLVFCTENMGYIQIPVIWFGNTAALAFELPTDPLLYDYVKKYGKEFNGQRRADTRHIVYLNEEGRVISRVPYKRKAIINPAFAKRSTELKVLPIKQMHESYKNKSYYGDWDLKAVEFHRMGKKSFYEKFEVFLEGMGWRGKECVLRILCESGNTDKEKQGTFMEEIFKATFTFPSSHKSELHEYDTAHRSKDCANLYPSCENIYGEPMYRDS